MLDIITKLCGKAKFELMYAHNSMIKRKDISDNAFVGSVIKRIFALDGYCFHLDWHSANENSHKLPNKGYIGGVKVEVPKCLHSCVLFFSH